MACGFCRKSLEGLKIIEKPKEKQKESNNINKFLSEISRRLFGLDPVYETFQCQMCQEYWRKISKIVIKGEEERNLIDSDIFLFAMDMPEFVAQTKVMPLGYDKSKIWED